MSPIPGRFSGQDKKGAKLWKTHYVSAQVWHRYDYLKPTAILYIFFHNFSLKCIMPANMGDNIPKLAGRYMNIIVLGASDSVP